MAAGGPAVELGPPPAKAAAQPGGLPAAPLGDALAPEGSPVLRLAATAILATSWLAWIWFVFAWFVYPVEWSYDKIWKPLTVEPSRWLLGEEGYVVMYMVPLYLIVFLAPLYFAIPKSSRSRRKGGMREKLSRTGRALLLPRSPFGPLSVAECFWACVFIALVAYAISKHVTDRLHRANSPSFKTKKPKYQWIWEHICQDIGWVGFMLLVLIFIPATRGSAILRLCGIPYEQAVKYHRWLCQAHVLLMSCHGVGYLTAWIDEGRLWKEISQWQPHGVSRLPGAIALLMLLIIFCSSIAIVRRRRFELFYYLHFLYIPYIAFVTLHLGAWALLYILPGLTCFAFDRVTRAIQSWNLVKADCLTILEDGSLEIVIPLATGVQYKALDIIFINVPLISRLQWHPFSICSSPLDGNMSLKVTMKSIGGWTKKLASHVETHRDDPLWLKAEGPYGQEQDFFAKYDELLLVAGGIGITPLYSLMMDLAHRCSSVDSQLPSRVTLVWSVRNEEDFHNLAFLDWPAICPQLQERVQVQLMLHVTRITASEVEAGQRGKSTVSVKRHWDDCQPMHAKVGQGYGVPAFFFTVFCHAVAFFVFVVSIRLLIWHYDHDSKILTTAETALSVLAGFLAAVIVAIALGSTLWYLLLPSTYKQVQPITGKDATGQDLLHMKPTEHFTLREQASRQFEISRGFRPLWNDIFEKVASTAANRASIGVIVSGPAGMNNDVARACYEYTAWPVFGGRKPVFNFHSASFEL
eukprot:SM000271S10031  [mRNA]  locus=s271:89812:94651:- [translate_table: standard]